VSLLQFMDKVSERQALELLRYHAGWNLALHRQMGKELGFERTVLVYFRQRLLEHKQGRLVFDRVLAGLVGAGLVARRSQQRLDSTQMQGELSISLRGCAAPDRAAGRSSSLRLPVLG
jgi:hypothetical protein